MRTLKKLLILLMIIVVTTTTLIGSNVKKDFTFVNDEPIRVGVILSNFDNSYISLVRENLEKIQKENAAKVKFTFFDGKGNQDIQNQIIDTVIKSDFDLLLTNLVDISTGNVDTVINKIKPKNIPIIFFNIEPFIEDSIKSYGKAIVIATDAEQSGVLQGQILVDSWNTNKEAIDKNKDNILQYVMLVGARDNPLTIARTKYSISTINNAGIKTQQLELRTSDGSKEASAKTIESVFLNYGNKIEAIIANNDTMAIGAVQALQKYGYNNGEKSKTIVVIGANGIPEAQELIKKGFMTGTVIQDAPAMAQALYITGINLASGNNPIEGTNYKFDETGVTIRLPYKGYIK